MTDLMEVQAETIEIAVVAIVNDILKNAVGAM